MSAQLAIRLPNGKTVGIADYCRAWKRLKSMPPQETVKGWSWWAQSAQSILRDIARGCEDRISRHDRTMARDLSDARLFTKIRAAEARGAIVYACRGCGSAIHYEAVNRNNPQTRYCSPECRQ